MKPSILETVFTLCLCSSVSEAAAVYQTYYHRWTDASTSYTWTHKKLCNFYCLFWFLFFSSQVLFLKICVSKFQNPLRRWDNADKKKVGKGSGMVSSMIERTFPPHRRFMLTDAKRNTHDFLRRCRSVPYRPAFLVILIKIMCAFYWRIGNNINDRHSSATAASYLL